MPRLLRMLLSNFFLFGDIIDALFHRGLSSSSDCLPVASCEQLLAHVLKLRNTEKQITVNIQCLSQ